MQAMETLSQSSRRPPAQAAGWQFWVDRGGTFTDVIGLSPAGELHVRKVPSASAGGAADDPGLRAVRAILAAAGAAPRAVAAVKVGTTVATNALLTRSGAPVVLVTSAGFADALRIGYQNRPDIFARDIVLPEPLYGTVIEAHERIDARGAVLTPLDGARLRADLTRARRAGARAVAIVFLHGWRHPQHEQEAASCARSLGFEEVSVSHELSPLVRYVSRGDTTVLNAYLAPPLRSYVGALHEQLRALDPQVRLTLMQSNGGLAAAESFHAMSSVLSGPAGGLIGMRWVGERLGYPRLIGFDMGGTATAARPSMPTRWRAASPHSPPSSARRARPAAAPRGSPNRSSRWGSSRWRTPSARYPPVRGAMRASSRCSASGARPASTPAASRAPPACGAFSCIRWRACCPPSASAWRTASPCAARACVSCSTSPGSPRRAPRLPPSKRRRAPSSPPRAVKAGACGSRGCWSCGPGTATSRCRFRSRPWSRCGGACTRITCCALALPRTPSRW